MGPAGTPALYSDETSEARRASMYSMLTGVYREEQWMSDFRTQSRARRHSHLITLDNFGVSYPSYMRLLTRAQRNKTKACLAGTAMGRADVSICNPPSRSTSQSAYVLHDIQPDDAPDHVQQALARRARNTPETRLCRRQVKRPPNPAPPTQRFCVPSKGIFYTNKN